VVPSSSNLRRNRMGGFTVRYDDGQELNMSASQLPPHVQAIAAPAREIPPGVDPRLVCGSPYADPCDGGIIKTAHCGCNSGHCGQRF
jgi:hypothetical protein